MVRKTRADFMDIAREHYRADRPHAYPHQVQEAAYYLAQMYADRANAGLIGFEREASGIIHCGEGK